MGDLEGTFLAWEAFRGGLPGMPWEGALGGHLGRSGRPSGDALGGRSGTVWEAVFPFRACSGDRPNWTIGTAGASFA